MVLYGRKYLKYFTEEEYIEDNISLEGNDWLFSQHLKIETIPKENDFTEVIDEYLSWKMSAIIRGDIDG